MNERRFRRGRTPPDLHLIVIATGSDRRLGRNWTENVDTRHTEIVSLAFEMKVTSERRIDEPKFQIAGERTRNEQIGTESQSNDRCRMAREGLQRTRRGRRDVPQIDQFIITRYEYLGYLRTRIRLFPGRIRSRVEPSALLDGTKWSSSSSTKCTSSFFLKIG
jgi:hypothetical protein